MTTPIASIAGEIHVSHHQFFLLDAGVYPEDGERLSWRSNGLVAINDGVVGIQTGIHTGFVALVVEQHSAAPPPNLQTWEDVVEHSVLAPAGEFRVAALMVEPDPPLQATLPLTPGICRVRVHARGRDIDSGGAPESTVERYLVQIWAEAGSWQNEKVLKSDSAFSVTSREGRQP